MTPYTELTFRELEVLIHKLNEDEKDQMAIFNLVNTYETFTARTLTFDNTNSPEIILDLR
jgi:hypothetical protein